MGFKQIAMKGLHFCKAHAPEIMIGASIVAGAAALYFTARGTMKLENILDEHKEKLDNLKDIHEDLPSTEESEKEYKKEVAKLYFSTAGKVALAYAPAVGLATASGALSLSAHGIMKKRVATALAAVESVSGAFEAYRQRVKDRFGEETEREILTGKRVEKVGVEETDAKGKTKIVEKDDITFDGPASPYAREFSAKTSDEFWLTQNNDGSGRSYNSEFLKSQEKAYDLKLRLRGFIFLNEVYKYLGFEETPEGQLVGWRANGDGDGYVNLNITKIYEGDNENDDVWLIDPNVDGIIFDKI